MGNEIHWFWALSGLVGFAALALLRRWSFLALFVLPLSVATPFALSSASGFPGLDSSDVIGACVLVLSLCLLGMKLGGYRFTFFTLYPGRGDAEPHDRS